MTSRLDQALQDLGEARPDLVDVERVDIDDAGTVMLTASGGGATRWFTHDDRGLIEHTPARDRKLPLAEHLRTCDDWRALSYRPGRRMVVVKCRGECVSVLKGLKRSRSARAAVNQGIAESAMRHGAFRVPRLLRHDGEHEALVFEFLEGEELSLEASNAAHYGTVGELLARFQEDEGALALKVFSVRDELDVLERWKQKVLLAVGELAPGWQDTRDRLAQLADTLGTPCLGLCHRDLHDRQVHLHGEHIVLLDFDLLCRADVAIDAGNLVAHLRWRALQGLYGAEEEGVEALQRCFLDGLGRAAEPGFARRLGFYTASTFLRLALVYRLRPRWSEHVSRLVSWASDALDDLAPID